MQKIRILTILYKYVCFLSEGLILMSKITSTPFAQKAYFIEEILNGMYDWVRVLDLENNIIYMNKAMSESMPVFSSTKKCFNHLQEEQSCKNCSTQKAFLEGKPFENEEHIGDKIYSVLSSPIKTESGEIIGMIEVLRDITNLKNLQEQMLEQNKKLKMELNLARKLQNKLLPQKIFSKKLKYSYIYQSCEAIGGDFYDIFKIDESRYGIYIADVSGHGVPASMLTVFLYSTFDKKNLSPSAALKKLFNEFNTSLSDENMYITVFYAIWDIKNNTLTYSNAGHNACPILFNKNKFEILRSSGIPISNWLENPQYKDSQISIEPNDKLFLYTDGIVELKNNKKEQFGEEKLLSILLHSENSLDKTLQNILDAAYQFSGISKSNSITDDITMLLIQNQ